MTKEDIIRMAREAGVTDAREYGETIPDECLERFARLIETAATEAANARANKAWTLMCEKMVEVEIHEAVLEEREACAKVAITYDSEPWKHTPAYSHVADMVSVEIGKAIRARGQK